MFENIDELIEVNLKLLYISKTQYMMRINFKDEYGFNLKNSKAFAEILVNKGLVLLECNQGFKCDLTDLGIQIYENGGWIKYQESFNPITKYNTDESKNLNKKKSKYSLLKKVTIASVIILVLCFFITIITAKIFSN